MKEDIQALKDEKENLIFLAQGLVYSHQANTRHALLIKAHNIQERIDELEKELNKNI